MDAGHGENRHICTVWQNSVMGYPTVPFGTLMSLLHTAVTYWPLTGVESVQSPVTFSPDFQLDVAIPEMTISAYATRVQKSWSF